MLTSPLTSLPRCRSADASPLRSKGRVEIKMRMIFELAVPVLNTARRRTIACSSIPVIAQRGKGIESQCASISFLPLDSSERGRLHIFGSSPTEHLHDLPPGVLRCLLTFLLYLNQSHTRLFLQSYRYEYLTPQWAVRSATYPT